MVRRDKLKENQLKQSKFMSQIFSSYTLGQLWDSSHLFDLSHTYLKHGTVMGSNICEWKQKYL